VISGPATYAFATHSLWRSTLRSFSLNISRTPSPRSPEFTKGPCPLAVCLPAISLFTSSEEDTKLLDFAASHRPQGFAPMSSPLHLRRVATPPMPVAPLGFSIFFSVLSRSFLASPKRYAKPTRRNPIAHHETNLRLPLSYRNFSARPKTAVSIPLLHTPSHRNETTFWANPSRLVHARGDPYQRYPHITSFP